jgi:hypothetical protein
MGECLNPKGLKDFIYRLFQQFEPRLLSQFGLIGYREEKEGELQNLSPSRVGIWRGDIMAFPTSS